MNQYPLWKNILIALVLAMGALYFVPNLYGESPAVQISATRSSVKVNADLEQRARTLLADAGVSAQAAWISDGSLKLRFADTDEQLRARDLLAGALEGNGYSVALNLISRSPLWLTDLGASPMHLGLDLRGGVHFLLQVDMATATEKALGRAMTEVRNTLREKDVPYAGVDEGPRSITVKFRDAEARARALPVLNDAITDLDFTASGPEDAPVLVGRMSEAAEKELQTYAVQQNISTLRNRVNELGVAEPIVQRAGADRVVVQLPGVQDTAKAKDILGRTATLEIRMVDEDNSGAEALRQAVEGRVPFGSELYQERHGAPVLVKKTVVLTGESITNAQPGFASDTNEPAVHITLDGRGARIFQRVTRENVGKRMAILLIEKNQAEVVTAPVIRTEIGGGRVQISGAMDTAEARDVALLLRAGALAAPMEIIEERTVGPSLGRENIEKGFYSTLAGFVLIAVFMMAYYRFFGVVAVVALVSNLMLLLALLSGLGATLTLPGIAGIALTVGMAIDANVLILERVREELRRGITPQAAINAGYDRALNTILDSNITTLIAGIALFSLGSGPVRGFAVTLCLGILTSMFSAVVVSRALVNLRYGRVRRLSSLSIG